MVSGDPPKAERELAADLRLHPQRPPVTRLSRKVLIGLASVAIMAVLSAVIWALDSRRSKQETGSELYNTEHKATADELAARRAAARPAAAGGFRASRAPGAGATRHRPGAAAGRSRD